MLSAYIHAPAISSLSWKRNLCRSSMAASSVRIAVVGDIKKIQGHLSSCRYLPKTVNWALMMSLFTIVPASCVLGSSWADWRHIFAQTKPNGSVEYLICLPAHGAVIGGWFGAWPMPLDWERPWQEWPISVSYRAIAGYLVAVVASCAFLFLLMVDRNM